MKRFLLLSLCCITQVVAAQEVLTIEQCRNSAIQNNKEIQMNQQKIKAADYERKAATTKYFPQLSAMGTYMYNGKNIQLVDYSDLAPLMGQVGALLGKLPPAIGAPVGGLIQGVTDKIKHATELDIQNVWAADISLIQPVYMGGKIIAYNQITRYAKALAESMHNTKLKDVIYTTDETYWQVVSLVNKQKLADSYVALLQKMDNNVQLLISEGVATAADGLSVKVKLNEAQMTQTKVENGLSLVRMLLAQLCGLPLESSFTLADENIKELTSTPQRAISTNIEEALANRSELKSLDYALKIYQKKETIIRSEALPSLAIAANYLVTNPNSFNGFKNEFAGMFNVGVILKVPISGWVENSFKKNAARAESYIKQLELEHAQEQIELQVNQSVYKVNEAEKKLNASQSNMRSADENLRYATLGFEEGVIPTINLMQAQTAWMQAHASLIDAQIEAKLTEVYLTKAMGTLGTN